MVGPTVAPPKPITPITTFDSRAKYITPRHSHAISTQQAAAASKQKEKCAASDVVKWKYDVAETVRLAAQRSECFAIYFCTERAALFVGIGAEARDAARKKPDAEVPPATVFDDTQVTAAFTQSKIELLVKVAQTADNESLFKQYAATPNSLVICASDGTVLKQFNGLDCNAAAVREYLRDDLKVDTEPAGELRIGRR